MARSLSHRRSTGGARWPARNVAVTHLRYPVPEPVAWQNGTISALSCDSVVYDIDPRLGPSTRSANVANRPFSAERSGLGPTARTRRPTSTVRRCRSKR